MEIPIVEDTYIYICRTIKEKEAMNLKRKEEYEGGVGERKGKGEMM